MAIRMIRRRQFIVVMPFLVAAPCVARADLYEDYINSTSKLPFVAFLARGGFPGHAFVGIGTQLEAGLIIYERFFGYYPTGEDKVAEAKLVFGKATGALDHKWKDTAWDVNYRIRVDDTKKKAALDVADKWKSNDPKYNLFGLGGKNCGSFAAEVAAAAGLKAPAGAGLMLPVDYIKRLRAANGG
jgi:hypothetical protein